MQWQEIRKHYPTQWLLVEAIKAHSEANQRIVDQLAVVGTFPDSVAALKSYTSPLRRLWSLRKGCSEFLRHFHIERPRIEVTSSP